ncbi:VCBS repeat-containing protein [Algoriphagus namhaensis]
MKTNSLLHTSLICVAFLMLGLNSFAQKSEKPVFKELNPKKLKINFKNTLKEDAQNNILRYEYFYNGAGVAVGDIDKDGLDDIFFTGNMSENKLFRNLGDWKFEDISKSAGISGKDSWTTGVSMADVNGDGWLDIYVSYSGKGDEASRKNELWINQKNLTFQDEAARYGLDDPSNSTQGLFFDYDRDGDLDLFLLNHHIQVITEIEFDQARAVRHPYAGDKLYRNDNGKFIDVSSTSGIKGNALGFGLGVVAADVNADGWPDLLVTNDYIEPDYLYINQQDGTFVDQTSEYFQHISHFSMGADISDINNDGLLDIYTLDMLPEDNERQKLLYGPENYEQYALMVERGFYHQNMRNMLQLNQGNGLFSEIGQLAQLSNTDWSWSALFFDANNDGDKDLLVTNGYYRDYTNRDFLKYKGDYYFKQAVAKEKADTLQLVMSMSSTPISNYIFENQGDLTFSDQTKAWGLEKPGFSSGAAYTDLDNDGDLDLVINHINDFPGIYENQSQGNYLKIQLQSAEQNTFGIGSKIEAITKSGNQVVEIQPVRGFQSSVPPIAHFGLGDETSITALSITWPDGTIQNLQDVPANQLLLITKDSKPSEKKTDQRPTLLQAIEAPSFTSAGATFNDFKRQPLMLTMPSYVAPVLAKSDLNGDGKLEVFVGGTKGQEAQIFTQNGDSWSPYPYFKSDQVYTDAVALFADFNGDLRDDLFLGSGGFHEYLSSDEGLADRLYLNDGQGKLIEVTNFADYRFSTGTAQALDMDGDGDLDLFVGAKLLPGRYPQLPTSKILLNDGQGNFTEAEENLLPNNGKLGLLTSSVKVDLNEDGTEDLILAGEFMSLTFLVNVNGKFEDQSAIYLDQSLSGWWNTLALGDFDRDGDLDVLAGNFGLNSQFKASEEKLLRLYSADFDENGSIDPILECYIGDEAYPFASRDELLDQMVIMRSKFTDYASYSTAKINDLFTSAELDKAQILEANTLSSIYLENRGSKFVPKELPKIAQSFPVYSFLPLDVNGDGHLDFIAGGNQNFTRIRIGMIDSGFGLVLLGDGKGNFRPINPNESGLIIKGDIKSSLLLDQSTVLFGVNQQAIKAYKINE